MKPEYINDWKAETWCYGTDEIDQFMIKFRGHRTGKLIQIDVFSAFRRYDSQPIGRFIIKRG